MNNRLWQVIGCTATVIAIIVSLAIFYWGQKASERALSVQVISTSRLFNADITKAAKDLRLLHKGKDVPNIAIIQIRITNSGRQPIRTEDIEVPISITFKARDIISSKVVSSIPRGLPIKIENSKSAITISKTLLNLDDEFTVEIIVVPFNLRTIDYIDYFEKDASGEYIVKEIPIPVPIVTGVSGRIAGIKKIAFTDTFPKEETSSNFWIFSVLASIFVGAITYLIFLLFKNKIILHLEILRKGK
jgi:hypothetical protein